MNILTSRGTDRVFDKALIKKLSDTPGSHKYSIKCNCPLKKDATPLRNEQDILEEDK